MIRAVLFDMGNTLFDFHRGRSDQEKDLEGLQHIHMYLKELGIQGSMEELQREFYEPWCEAMEKRKITGREYEIDPFLNSYTLKYGRRLNRDECVEAIRRFYRGYVRELYMFEDVLETLQILRSRGIKIGIVSNTPYYEEAIIDCFISKGIHEHIDAYTFSYGLGEGKPCENIFKEALRRVGTEAEQTIMIGDKYLKDVKPAVSLGLKGIWINRENNDGVAEGCIEVIQKLHEIAEIL